jgi:hypothetical protein
LCFWFGQITLTTPRRRTILHLAHTFFTDALTFIARSRSLAPAYGLRPSASGGAAAAVPLQSKPSDASLGAVSRELIADRATASQLLDNPPSGAICWHQLDPHPIPHEHAHEIPSERLAQVGRHDVPTIDLDSRQLAGQQRRDSTFG